MAEAGAADGKATAVARWQGVLVAAAVATFEAGEAAAEDDQRHIKEIVSFKQRTCNPPPPPPHVALLITNFVSSITAPQAQTKPTNQA